jgi:adenine phosphoribosyltransferase
MPTPSLSSQFLDEARVIDSEKGYISATSFNVRMKPEILSQAAAEIAQHFAGEGAGVVHGIPHSGTYLATAVALALGGSVRLHASRKDQLVPTTWKELYRQELRSFTAQQGGVDVFSTINLSFVRKGEKVLLVDDVCASGTTAVSLIKGMQQLGVEVVGFAVLFDKVFQGGLERVEELGVKCYSCVRVQKVTKGVIHLQSV